MSLKFTRIEARQRITTFPGKLKGILHSQEDATNIFSSPMHNISKLCAVCHKHP